MELVRVAIAVSDADRLKSCIVIRFQATNLSHRGTKATIAQITIAAVTTVVGYIVAGNAVTTLITMDFGHDDVLDEKTQFYRGFIG
jgi:putative Ca2+/H+ antiporter (TMEM165/GDT1 family)